MAQLNRTCLACKTKYSYCPNCSRVDKLAPAWKTEFCSEPCMTLWTTLTKYGMSMLSKSEAKSIITDLDLKPIDKYVECVKRDYAKVMTEDKKPKRNKRIEIKHIDEAMEIEAKMADPIVVELNAKIKDIFADKAVVETWLNDGENRQSHEVVLEEKNKEL